jgi:hypothetical protein
MKSIIVFLGTIVFMYLVGAFIYADFNTATWGITGRMFVALTTLFLAGALASTVHDE